MSRLVSYEELVDVLRGHIQTKASCLITGVSENQHSFLIGIKQGKIVMMTYRIFKSGKALDKLLLIKTAKIIEHLNTEPPGLQLDLPDTSSIMASLSLDRAVDNIVDTGDVINYELPDLPPKMVETATQNANQAPPPSGQRKIYPNQIKAIKAAAIHYFGPMGAMVCEDHLTTSNISSIDLRTLLMRIAKDVGAGVSDTEAFIDRVVS